jgi:CheY-like chemotaxis protein
MNGDISVLLVDDESLVTDLVAHHLERIHDNMTVAVETSAEMDVRVVESERGARFKIST